MEESMANARAAEAAGRLIISSLWMPARLHDSAMPIPFSTSWLAGDPRAAALLPDGFR
jgi:hypothetical protein